MQCTKRSNKKENGLFINLLAEVLLRPPLQALKILLADSCRQKNGYKKNLQAKFLTPGGEDALKNFKDLVGNMKGVLAEIDPAVFPQASQAAIRAKVTDIQNNLTTEKAKVATTQIWISALPNNHPKKQELEAALQAARGNLDLQERFKGFALAGGIKYQKEHTDKINHHAKLLLEEASKKLDSVITPIKPKIEQEYVERVVAGKIAQLNTPSSKEAPRLKALWSYVPADARQDIQNAAKYFAERITNTPNIKILEIPEREIGTAFEKNLLQYVNAIQYAEITKQILEKLAADRPFFVTAKNIKGQKNSDYTAIQSACTAYQRLDAGGKKDLLAKTLQAQELQTTFTQGGIAALEVAVAKKILALVETPEKGTTPETTVVAAFAAPQKENITREMITPLEQPATDLSTPIPTPLPASIPSTQEMTNEPAVVSCVKASEEVYVPFIVLGELRYGFLKGAKREQNERNLVKFLNLPQVFVLTGDAQTSFFYAEIVEELRKNGIPIPTNDIWIAALSIQHNLVLYTRDQHFACVKALAKM